MIIKTIASGSKGNCYYLNDGSTSLLLECGISFKRIKDSLGDLLNDVQAVLITHEHKDHCQAVKMLDKKGFDMYYSEGTEKKIGIPSKKHLKPFESFKIGTWTITPFDVKHDAEEPIGYVLTSDNGYRVLFATDTYYIKYVFPGLTHVLLECNYDEETLEHNYNNGLEDYRYKRILQSHMGLKSAKRYLNSTDLGKVGEIHVIHVSNDNANRETIEKELFALTNKKIVMN